MSTSKIDWTDCTWNPITGCTKCSPGCLHCYAENMAMRLMAMGIKKYSNAFEVTLHEDDLEEPVKWKKRRNIFVCSMSDLFHEEVSFSFIDKIMNVIERTPQHRYQLLTKRADRMYQYFTAHTIPSNVWLGVTVECRSSIKRIDYLRGLKASVKFLSCEPLIEDLGVLDFSNIDWIIVGGESGRNARPMKEEWAVNIQRQVEEQGKAFFFKQWGTWGSDGVKRNKHANGKKLNGKIYHELPE
mgnify:CR=1 FL=1